MIALPLAVLTGVLSLWFSVGPIQDLFSGTFNQPLPLSSPSAVAFDGRGQVYVLEDPQQRLVAFTPDGTLLWTIPGLVRAGTMADSAMLVGRPGGGLVLANPGTGELLAVSADGRLEGVLVRVAGSTTLVSLETHGGDLWYQTLSDRRLTLRSRPLALGGPVDPQQHHVLFEAPLPDGLQGVQAVSHLPEGVLLLDRSGRVWLLDASGKAVAPAWSGQENPGFVTSLQSGPEGSLILLDAGSQAILRADSLNSPLLTTVLGPQDVRRTGRPSPAWKDVARAPDGTLAVVDPYAGTVFLREATGAMTVISGLTLTESALALNQLLVALALSFVCFLAWAVVGLLRRLFSAPVSAVGKQLALTIPLLVAMVIAGTLDLYQGHEARNQESLRTKLLFVAGVGSSLIGGDLLQDLSPVHNREVPSYRKLLSQVNGLLPPGERAQVRVYRVVNDQFFLVISPDPLMPVMTPWVMVGHEPWAVARGGTVEYVPASDLPGSRSRALAPLRGSQGTIEGVLEVSQSPNDEVGLERVYGDSLAASFPFPIALILVMAVVASLVLARTTRRREPSDAPLADAGTMNARQVEHFGRLNEVGVAIARFVPRELVGLLGRANAADVQQGDRVRRSVTLVWGQLPPQESTELINRVLDVAGPVARRHGGFLLLQEGESFVAVLPGKAAAGERGVRAIEQALAQVAGLPGLGLGAQTAIVVLGIETRDGRLKPELNVGLEGVRSLAQQALSDGGGLLFPPKTSPL